MIGADRIACSVPFCRRTAPRAKFPDAVEVICGRHSRLADRRVRLAYRAAKRKLDRADNERHRRQCTFFWERLLRQAVERSAGVTA